VALNRQSSLTRGLVLAWRANEPIDLTSGVKPTETGLSRGQKSWKFAGGAEGASDANFGLHASTNNLHTQPATFAFLATSNVLSETALACHTDANSDRGWSVGYHYDDHTGPQVFGLGLVHVAASTNLRVITTTLPPAGSIYSLVIASDSTSAGTKIWLNGVPATLSASPDATGGSGVASAESLYLGRRRFDTALSHNGSIYVATISNRVWTAAEALAFHRDPYSLWTNQAPVGRRATYLFAAGVAFTASSLGFLPSSPPSVAARQLSTRAINAEAPPGQRIATTALGAIATWSVDPPRRTQSAAAQPNDTGSQFFSMAAYGEPIVNDLPISPFVRAPRMGDPGQVFSTIGFAPSPRFTGWSVDPPAKCRVARPASAPETALGTRITASASLSQFTDFAPPARRTSWAATTPASDAIDYVGAPLLGPAFSAWSVEALRGASAPSLRIAAESWFLGTTQPPPGVFAQWASDSPRSQGAPSPRAGSDSWPLEFSAFPTSTFTPWSVDATRPSLVGARSPAEAFALAPLSQPPGVFADWSVSSPATWKQPLARPQTTLVTSVVSLPPSTSFFDWFVAERRSTAVTSRPPGESVLTGQFIPPPVLLGTPWQQSDSPRAPTPARSAQPADAYIGSLLSLGGVGVPWQQDATRLAQRFGRPIAESFVGGALAVPVVLTGTPWAQDPLRSAVLPARRPTDVYVGSVLVTAPALAPFFSQDDSRPTPKSVTRQTDSYVGGPLGLPGVPWASSDAARPGALQRARTQDGFTPTALAPVISVFTEWASSAAQHAQPVKTARDQAWSLAPTIPPPITGYVGWSVEPPPVWRQPYARTVEWFFFQSLTDVFVFSPATSRYRAPARDARSSRYTAKPRDGRS
jgi:hypothetical protein